ncbi:ABC transporter permease [Gluconacetobacter azotocaptans]|uniref:ABC transporter permease n=1 Tax=Gluconacetobacter azotocaptans TaxID=142834 RepID=UPI00195E4960|nr:ABC transporter permease [Gluconacetobacter azotocaptans]MBM9400463.1 ABC transporter permease [Gluconacetobacter azotocaptans]
MNTPSLLTLFKVQIRVIGALLMRELHTRFGRENLGYLWIVGEPILFCAGVAVAWTAIRPAHEHGLPTTAIVITGYVPLTMWRHCLFQSVKAFNANGSLLFHRQVTPLDLILSRVILEVVGALIAGLIVTIGAIVLGFMKPPADYGLLYLGLFYHILFCLGTALLVAPISEISEIMEKMVSIISYLSIPASGAFSMVDWVSPHYRWILLLSPSVNNIEMIRGGQFGYSAHAHFDLVYNSWATVIMILMGLSLTLRTRRHILVQ